MKAKTVYNWRNVAIWVVAVVAVCVFSALFVPAQIAPLLGSGCSLLLWALFPICRWEFSEDEP